MPGCGRPFPAALQKARCGMFIRLQQAFLSFFQQEAAPETVGVPRSAGTHMTIGGLMLRDDKSGKPVYAEVQQGRAHRHRRPG